MFKFKTESLEGNKHVVETQFFMKHFSQTDQANTKQMLNRKIVSQ